jgi:hypothetical protein
MKMTVFFSSAVTLRVRRAAERRRVRSRGMVEPKGGLGLWKQSGKGGPFGGMRIVMGNKIERWL